MRSFFTQYAGTGRHRHSTPGGTGNTPAVKSSPDDAGSKAGRLHKKLPHLSVRELFKTYSGH